MVSLLISWQLIVKCPVQEIALHKLASQMPARTHATMYLCGDYWTFGRGRRRVFAFKDGKLYTEERDD